MDALFLNILNMSITASYVILAIMLARIVLLKAPKKYSYALWAAAAFRLCIPFSLSSVFSLFNLNFLDIKGKSDGSISYVPSDIGTSNNPEVNLGLPAVNDGINGALPNFSAADSGGTALGRAIDIIAVIWFAGAVLFFAYGIFTYIKAKHYMRTAIIAEDNVYESEKISSPFVLGSIKPKIYIPFGLNGEARRYVLAHERYHIKRLDYIIKPLAFVILAVHWFNPLCWAAFTLMSRDMEMSCDEKVLSSSGISGKEYSITLLSIASGKHFPAPSPLAFGETSVKSRIKNALSFKKPRVWVSITSALLCIVLLAACLFNPSVEREPDFDGIYRIDEIVYLSVDDGEEAIDPFMDLLFFELTPNHELTSILSTGIEEYPELITRFGAMYKIELTEEFDAYFEDDGKDLARKIREENEKAWLASAKLLMLLQKDGEIYSIDINDGKVSSIFSLKWDSDAKYTNQPIEVAYEDMPCSLGGTYAPIKFEVDYDKITAECSRGYFKDIDEETKKITVSGNETIYWRYDMDMITNPPEEPVEVITLKFYKGLRVVHTATVKFRAGEYVSYIEFEEHEALRAYRGVFSERHVMVIREK